MKQFQLDLGDWSCDGHCQTHTAIFNTDLEIHELREIYFKNCEKFGKVLESICEEYEDYYIREEDLKHFLEAGMTISEDIREAIKDDGEYPVGTTDFVNWFMEFMKLDGDEFHLEHVPPVAMPHFHFYGLDEKGRHVGGFAYGIFE